MLIVSPDFPPARGGVADHTLRLAQMLAARGPVAVLTSAGNASHQPFPVHGRVRDWSDWQALGDSIESLASNRPVLWQYVPHMYGRGGVNSGLGQVMRRLHERGQRQWVIAHEIAAPLAVAPHQLWYALNHRRQWRQILATADAVGISTEAWLDDWRNREPQRAGKLFLLPSPATIPLVSVPGDHGREWRRAQGLPADCRVLAYFGSLSASKQFDWVLAAWGRAQVPGSPVALVLAGGDARAGIPDALRSFFRPLGYQAPEDVSRLLQAADVLALPFVDGVSERRTSFMAGLSHGCAVATTLGLNTGPTLRQADFFAANEANDQEGFVASVSTLLSDAARRQKLAAAARAAYVARYDWPHVIASLENAGRRLDRTAGSQKVTAP